MNKMKFMKNTEVKIDLELGKKVLNIVNKGLCSGLGSGKPGDVCVEAAVCLAMGLPNDDDPPCVNGELRKDKMNINDADKFWKSEKDRANGLKKIAIAQLGSIKIDNYTYKEVLAKIIKKKFYPIFIKEIAKEIKYPKFATNRFHLKYAMDPWFNYENSKITSEFLYEDTLFMSTVDHIVDFLQKDVISDVLARKLINVVIECMIDVLRVCKCDGIKIMDELFKPKKK